MKRAEFKCQNGAAEVWIYDLIGNYWGEGISADQFRKDIEALGKIESLTVHINSPGGSAFDGITMYNALRRLTVPVTASIDGVAASAAAIVAMGADRVTIAESAQMMIHEAMAFADGRAADFRALADRLDALNQSQAGIFAAKSATDTTTVLAWLDAETWFTAAEAKAAGLVDDITERLDIAACIRPGMYKNTPDKLIRPRGQMGETGALAPPYRRREGEAWLASP